jgi:hypothetical protein
VDADPDTLGQLGVRAGCSLVPDVITGGDMLIVGLGGTTRQNSSSERALKTGLTAASDCGADTVLLGAPTAVRLIDHLRAADGVIVASPGYHGAISGLINTISEPGFGPSDQIAPKLQIQLEIIGRQVAEFATMALNRQEMREIARPPGRWPCVTQP